MNDLERLRPLVRFERPDYVPIFGFPGAPCDAGDCMAKTHDRGEVPSHLSILASPR